MPGRGPAPSPERSRERDNPKLEELVDTGERYGDPLPDGVLPHDGEWCAQTLEFWDALRRMPLLKNEPPLGWAFLMDTALMHNAMWQNGRWEFAAELRLRVAKYGATPEDRQRLKIKVVDGMSVRPAKPANKGNGVTSINTRRARLKDA